MNVIFNPGEHAEIIEALQIAQESGDAVFQGMALQLARLLLGEERVPTGVVIDGTTVTGMTFAD